jgi:hypothetical protein
MRLTVQKRVLMKFFFGVFRETQILIFFPDGPGRGMGEGGAFPHSERVGVGGGQLPQRESL